MRDPFNPLGGDRDHTRWPGWKPPHRPNWGMEPIRGTNRLIQPCPGCGAKRYEKCSEYRSWMDEETGERGRYPIVKDDPCSVRPIKEAETEEEKDDADCLS